MILLTVVLGCFFAAITMCLSSVVVGFLGQPVQCLLLSTQVGSFFLRTFQIAVLAIA